MPPPQVKQQQKKLLAKLIERFGSDCAKEWPAFPGVPERYSPRLDLAVGPFLANDLKLRAEYCKLAGQHWPFLERLWSCHRQNAAGFADSVDPGPHSLEQALTANQNARCFLAIEIENKVSRKHLMGGAVNAAALGHLGIVIGWTDEKVRAMFRVRQYLRYLGDVRKPTMGLGNLLILGRKQAIEAFGSD